MFSLCVDLSLATKEDMSMKKYEIQQINDDNWRPGMPKEGYLVRYRPSEFGWTGRRCFAALDEAESFAASLTPEGNLPLV